MPQQFHQAEEAAPLQLGVPKSLAEPTAPSNAPRYTADEIKRIIAEAERLQDHHRETLPQSDVEAIAQEVGIDAKFVRQAIEQVGTDAEFLPRRRRRLSAPQLQPLPFHTVAKNAVLPILCACLLIPITSWLPESEFTNWFLFLYIVLPPLLAFLTGFLRNRIRLGMVSGAFWGAAILFSLAVPQCIKVHQNLGEFKFDELTQMSSDFSQFLLLLMLFGAIIGTVGVLTRRGVDKGRNWYKNRCSCKTGATITAFHSS